MAEVYVGAGQRVKANDYLFTLNHTFIDCLDGQSKIPFKLIEATLLENAIFEI